MGGATLPHEKVAHKAASHKVSAASVKLVGCVMLPHEKVAHRAASHKVSAVSGKLVGGVAPTREGCLYEAASLKGIVGTCQRACCHDDWAMGVRTPLVPRELSVRYRWGLIRRDGVWTWSRLLVTHAAKVRTSLGERACGMNLDGT